MVVGRVFGLWLMHWRHALTKSERVEPSGAFQDGVVN